MTLIVPFSGFVKLNRKGVMLVFFFSLLTFSSSSSSGPFIERAIIASHTSEALWFRSEDVLPQPEAEKVE